MSYYNPSELFEVSRLLPVVVLKELSDTAETLTALKEAGIPSAEITFRTACAADAIALARKEFPDMIVGAGTVIDGAQAKTAIAAGAQFIVSPGLSVAVAAVCRAAEIPYIPG